MSTSFEKQIKYAKEDLELPSEVAKGDIFGIKDPSKFPVPEEIKRIIREKKARKMGKFTIVKALSPENKEIVFDFEKEREHWLDFYKKHDIDAQIPEIKFTQKQTQEIEKLIKYFGFDKAIIIPENLPNYPELHQKMTLGYLRTFQGENFKKEGSLEGSFDGVEDLKRGARIIFTRDVKNIHEDSFFKQTVNLPPEDPSAPNDLKRFIENIKQEKGIELEGFALSVYLIYQKEYHERTNQYKEYSKRTYDYLDEDKWNWLTGSKLERSYHVPGIGSSLGCNELVIDVVSSAMHVKYEGCRLAKSFELKR